MNAVVLIIVGIIAFAAMLILGIGLLIESKRDKAKWHAIAAELTCPQCGSRFDIWRGDSWGVDANPPEYSAYGNTLICPNCNAPAYILQDGDEYRVYDTIEQAMQASNELKVARTAAQPQ